MIKIDNKPVSVPVPDSVTTCELPGASSAMDKVPVRIPRTDGLKVTEIVQLAPAPNLWVASGQVEVWEKSPEVEIPEIVNGTVWLFFSVKLVGALAMPNNRFPNEMLAGVRVIGRFPVPLNCAVCEILGASSFTDIRPVRRPETVGVKVTEIVQVSFAPKALGDIGQVDVCAKSPEVEIPEIVRGTVWLFCTVKTLAAPVVFTTWVLNCRLEGDKVTGMTPVPVN